jgi:hypothetical protein
MTCNDSNNNTYTLSNQYLEVDLTAPLLDWNWADINSTITVDYTTICANTSESANGTLHFNGTNYINSTFSTNICWSLSSLSNGNYSTINATLCDSLSNCRNTTNAWLNVEGGGFSGSITSDNITFTVPSQGTVGTPFTASWAVSIGSEPLSTLNLSITNHNPTDCHVRDGYNESWTYTSVNGTVSSSTQYICDNKDNDGYLFTLTVDYSNSTDSYQLNKTDTILIPVGQQGSPSGGDSVATYDYNITPSQINLAVAHPDYRELYIDVQNNGNAFTGQAYIKSETASQWCLISDDEYLTYDYAQNELVSDIKVTCNIPPLTIEGEYIKPEEFCVKVVGKSEEKCIPIDMVVNPITQMPVGAAIAAYWPYGVVFFVLLLVLVIGLRRQK